MGRGGRSERVEVGASGVVRRRALVATMADGVELVADAWHPPGGGPWPVLLQRLPYGRAVASAPVLPHPVQLARSGYAVVSQDVRGRGDSGGTFAPFASEADDGAASVEWAARLPFCDGQVATYGFSYQGTNQLLAAARRPHGLRAIAPLQCAPGAYEGWTYAGGCLQLPFAAPWAAQLAGQEPGAAPPPVDLGALPVAGALGPAPPAWWSEWLAHPEPDDDYWAARTADLDAIGVPVFVVAGWHDAFAAATARLAARLGAEAVFGPWGHMPWGSHLGGQELGPDAGPGAAHRALVAFLDRVLKGRGAPPVARVRYYTGGVGWRTAPAWPPPAAAVRPWALSSAGGANSRHGDGRLVPGDADPGPCDVLAAEPLVPVPGGLDPLSDESATEDRRDVLCYTSEPLVRALVVTGAPVVSVTAAADAATHDLVATLTVVEPGGRSLRLTTGARRLRDRQPGRPTTATIELGPISWRVPGGHRLRLDVSASRFPAYDRNPQAAGPVAQAGRDDCRVALVEVHAGRLDLPVEDDGASPPAKPLRPHDPAFPG